jgi:hypothetical protein
MYYISIDAYLLDLASQTYFIYVCTKSRAPPKSNNNTSIYSYRRTRGRNWEERIPFCPLLACFRGGNWEDRTGEEGQRIA